LLTNREHPDVLRWLCCARHNKVPSTRAPLFATHRHSLRKNFHAFPVIILHVRDYLEKDAADQRLPAPAHIVRRSVWIETEVDRDMLAVLTTARLPRETRKLAVQNPPLASGRPRASSSTSRTSALPPVGQPCSLCPHGFPKPSPFERQSKLRCDNITQNQADASSWLEVLNDFEGKSS
jgi:hypothetical protein